MPRAGDRDRRALAEPVAALAAAAAGRLEPRRTSDRSERQPVRRERRGPQPARARSRRAESWQRRQTAPAVRSPLPPPAPIRWTGAGLGPDPASPTIDCATTACDDLAD